MFLWNLIGHQKITHFLEQGIVNDKLAQAYLFYGPKQIGKKTLTKKFIQILMCYHNGPAKTLVPCDQCNHCLQLEKNIHPDVFWLKKEEDKKDISIEQIRELQDKLSVHSFFKTYKVAVIEGAEFLNHFAANALLKTLEEPTRRTLIILMAERLNHLPLTVLSRVQKIKFLPVADKEIYDYLLKQKVAHERALLLAKIANGRPGRALFFLHQPEFWQSYLSQVKNFFALINSSRSDKIKFAERILLGKDALIEKVGLLIPLLNLWQMLSRDLLLSKLNQNDRIINMVSLEKIIKVSQGLTLRQLIDTQKYIELTKRHLRLNVNPRLALENLLLFF